MDRNQSDFSKNAALQNYILNNQIMCFCVKILGINFDY